MRISSLSVSVVAILILLVVFVIGCSAKPTDNKSYQEISGLELQKLLDNQEQLMILDVREGFEYQEGHLPAAKLIPLGELTARLSELNKEQKIIVVCASGSRSSQAAGLLTKQGFTKVYNLTGGMMNWSGSVEQ